MAGIDDHKNIKLPNLAGIMLAAGAIIGALEILSPSKGSLLLLLTYWTAIVEGSIALVAAAELSNAKWIQPLKLKLLVLYYMIPFLMLLFLLMFMRMEVYPWMGHQTRWLNKSFFMSRNLFLFLIIFAAARKFVVSSVEERESKKKYAVLYLLAFVCSQSFVAFDWIMPLEYPWISTLFGGFFFVEAVYSGIVVFILSCAFSDKQDSTIKMSMRDAATLLFGFSLFWAGLFYAQFLVIWYGNLPEEAGFVFKRVSQPPYKLYSRLVLACLFVVPFTVLLSKPVKSNRIVVSGLGFLILSGLLLEKILMIHLPAPINWAPVPVEFAIMGFIFVLLWKRVDLPQEKPQVKTF